LGLSKEQSPGGIRICISDDTCLNYIACHELAVALKGALLNGTVLILLEKLYGFLDNHADTSLSVRRDLHNFIVDTFDLKGDGVAEGIKTGDRMFLLEIQAGEI